MHCVNCSIFFWPFIRQPCLSIQNKARLLEWKGRVDLAMYASRRAPKPYTEDIIPYERPQLGLAERARQWQEIFARVSKDPEDGHASKIVRTLAAGEKLCEGFEGRKEFPVKEAMWLAIALMGSFHASHIMYAEHS